MRCLLLFLFCIQSVPLFAQGIDHSIFDQFLKRVVDEDGRINYRTVKENHADLNRYLKQIESIKIESLDNESQAERLAFWINVYHAELVAQVIKNYPIHSTQDIPNFWDRQFVHFQTSEAKSDRDIQINQGLSLNQIRRDYLMSLFQNERVHLALAVAAKDGPFFPREAYRGENVLGQLFKKVRAEVNRSSAIKIDAAQSKVYLSKIFEWYASDFSKNFGRPERRGKLNHSETAAVNFLIHYLHHAKDIQFLKSAKYKVEYLPFDWSLNDQSLSAE